MSKFVERVIDQVESVELHVSQGRCVDSLLCNIRAALTAREALLDRMAEALRVALDCASYGAVLEDADVWDDVRSVLTAYEGSKQ